MELYRKTIQNRIKGSVAVGIAGTIFVIVAGIWGYNRSLTSTEHMSDFLNGFIVGLFIAFAGFTVVGIVRSVRALKDERKLRAMYIAETDERAKLIRDKVGGVGFDLSLAILMIAATVSNFFDQTIAITIIAALFVMAMIKGGLKLYYTKRY